MKLNSQFLKLELEDSRILYIAKDDICLIIYHPKKNYYAIFKKVGVMKGMDTDPEHFSEEKDPKAYKAIKTYLLITAG